MIARRNILTALIGLAAALVGARRGDAVQLTDAVKAAPPPGPEVSKATHYWMGTDGWYVIDGHEFYKLSGGRWHRYGSAGWVGK